MRGDCIALRRSNTSLWGYSYLDYNTQLAKESVKNKKRINKHKKTKIENRGEILTFRYGLHKIVKWNFDFSAYCL